MTPPATRTAYFCSIRRPGTVLRESRTRVRVPASACTQAAVAVATPDIRVSRLSATRSAVSSARALPVTVASTSPRRHRRAVGGVQDDLESPAGSQTTATAYAATDSPATVPACRATNSPRATASAGMVANEVTSNPAPVPGGSTPRPPRSSPSASETISATASGSSPSAVTRSIDLGQRG